MTSSTLEARSLCKSYSEWKIEALRGVDTGVRSRSIRGAARLQGRTDATSN